MDTIMDITEDTGMDITAEQQQDTVQVITPDKGIQQAIMYIATVQMEWPGQVTTGSIRKMETVSPEKPNPQKDVYLKKPIRIIMFIPTGTVMFTKKTTMAGNQERTDPGRTTKETEVQDHPPISRNATGAIKIRIDKPGHQTRT